VKKKKKEIVAADVEKRRAGFRCLALPKDLWFSGEGLG
jgi:hypothetical protein